MKYYIVDVFAEKKYQGNQLAVFLPENELSTIEMQQIAREMNFSETTFITSGKQENGGYDVRIFTPDTEVPFAGHPTLGTAFIIHELIENRKKQNIYLNLEVGKIPVSVNEENFVMRQNQPEFGMTFDDREMIGQIVNLRAEDVDYDFPVQVASTGLPCVVVPLNSVDAIERCVVNHKLFQEFIDTYEKCNYLVFAREGENRLRVRVFMDDPGFLEDPATGSANGNLAGYLLKYGYFGQNAIEYTVSQGSEMGRPSIIRVSATLDNGEYDIHVGGRVELVSEGEWL